MPCCGGSAGRYKRMEIKFLANMELMFYWGRQVVNKYKPYSVSESLLQVLNREGGMRRCGQVLEFYFGFFFRSFIN